jgi:hypothetical protein
MSHRFSEIIDKPLIDKISLEYKKLNNYFDFINFNDKLLFNDNLIDSKIKNDIYYDSKLKKSKKKK